MKNLHELDKYRVKHWMPQTDHSGAFKVYVGGRSFCVLASVDDIGEEGKWEHISVTPGNLRRQTCPTWEEMAAIKDMFFFPEEECIEYHPKRSRYVNMQSFCLHIWRPADGNLRYPDMKEIPTIAKRDAQLEELWSQFEDVPMDPETERIEEDFYCFPHGTPREEIWHWFDERYSGGVYSLLYNDGVDNTDTIAKLVYLYGECFDCDTKACGLNDGGTCKFPLVHGRLPKITEEDGCTEGSIEGW